MWPFSPLSTGVTLALPTFPPPIPPSCPQSPAMNVAGVLCEDFDSERNGVPGFQFTRLPTGVDPNDPLFAIGDPNDDVLGYTQDTGGSARGTAGRTCADDLTLNLPTCSMPVAEENDWHLHSPFEGPGDGYDPPGRPGIGAPDGGKAHSGFRSMHWGRHLDPASTLGDATRFRQVSAFVLDPPVNLGPGSTMQFWHIISVIDNEFCDFGTCVRGTSFGGAQVQISLLGAGGQFERWRRLTPTFNGYDETVQETAAVCEFDPGDDDLPPTDETMCDYSPMWGDLGDIIGTDATCTVDTDGNDPAHKDCGAISSCAGGPGCTENGSIGNGVWARSAFDLSSYAGRTARLRWVGMMGGGWSFGASRSALEPEPGNFAYQYFEADDGWWVDDIALTDLREAPLPCTTDADADGTPICGDCDDANPQAWAIPGEATDLSFAADGQTLVWSPPVAPGGSALVYDLLRRQDSLSSPDAFQLADCVESNGSDLTAVDTAIPTSGKVFFYLVRAENTCPYGAATPGTDSNGVPRIGRACP